MKQGKLFVFSGPSASGKGTICKRLIDESRREDLCLSVSVTTRKPREGEEEGVHYYFIDEDRFREMAEHGQLLEFAEVYGRHYGTPKEKGKELFLFLYHMMDLVTPVFPGIRAAISRAYVRKIIAERKARQEKK